MQAAWHPQLMTSLCFYLQSAEHIRYYAGWADKIYGKVAPTAGNFQALIYKEPLGKPLLQA